MCYKIMQFRLNIFLFFFLKKFLKKNQIISKYSIDFSCSEMQLDF